MPSESHDVVGIRRRGVHRALPESDDRLFCAERDRALAPATPGRLLAKLLFGVTRDLPTLIVVPVLLGGVTVVALWIPARRAMRLDPVAVIRAD